MIELYNGYHLCACIQLVLFMALIITSYILIRSVFAANKFEIKSLNNKLKFIMIICIIIASLTLFTAIYEVREEVSHPIIGGGYGSSFIHTNEFSFNIALMLYFENGDWFLFRTISIVLYVISAILLLKGFKKSNFKLLLISLLLGVIANLAITLEYEFGFGIGVMSLYNSVSFIGTLTLLIAIGIGIYQIVYKKKHIE